MSLDYVKKGEAVKASTVNSIIDAIGGNQRMSPDLNVTTTTRGAQVSLPSNYGGPNNAKNQLLEVGKYQLSGWPMTQLMLGPEIEDCLGIIRLHKSDGTVQTSVSAAVIFKNSDDCPTGSDLSGYLLSSEQFGYDKERHASGWFRTMMEDPYCGDYMGAQLWKYQDGEKLATVFTNVDSEISVKTTLTSLLNLGGEDAGGLSSISRIDAWKLIASTRLSSEIDGQVVWIPTHEYIENRGPIDVYEPGFQDYDVVLKAKLVCINVNKSDPDPETGETEVESTDWAWQIPLGPGATCDEGKASSPNLTYGGNPIVFEVEEGDIGEDYSGEATYNNGVITFGKFTAQADQELEAGELWLNLSYEYQDKYVKGQFSDEQDSGTYTQDGILSRNVFVISAKNFTPNVEEVDKGTEASIDFLTYGTWGVLPKDGPKLDTYCKKDSSTEFKSLDWADREGEVVECQCAELHEFDQLETVDPLSTDHLVIRRPDDNDGAELKYISLSALEISGMYVPPDADVEDAETSSLQTRELDNGTNVEELFQFHLSDTVDVRISDLTSVDVVIRNPNNGQPYIEYGRLCIDIAPDAQGQTGQKSIDWLNGTDELQLYKFDESGLSVAFEPDVTVNGTREYILPNEYEFVLRKNGAGGEVTYGQVALSVKVDELSGDSQVGDQKSININNNIIELYKMGQAGAQISSEVPTSFDEPESILSDNCEFVIRKGGAGGEIDYTTVKLKQAHLSVDSDTNGQKSVQYNPTSNELQLYKMHQNGEAGHSVTITPSLTSLLPSNYELVVRKGGAGGQIEYTTLSASISSAIELDTQATAQQKSLEWKTHNNKTYAQLYKMDAAGEPTEDVDLKWAKNSFQSLLPDDEEFVIRTREGGEIQYKNIGLCLSAYLSGGVAISGDNEKTPSQKSIDLVFNGDDPDYYQLHDMDKAGTSLPRKTITLSSDGYTPLLPSDYEFVLRQNGAGGTIKYANLSCCIPDLSALSGTTVSGDTNVVQNYQSIETKEDSNGKKYHEIYNFDTGCATKYESNVRFWDPYYNLSAEEGLGCGAEFLVRRSNENGGYSISYEKIVALQEHERLDSDGLPSPRGYSLDYTAYDHGYGCEQVMQLWAFDQGCASFITSADITNHYGNGILIRKWDGYGCCWLLDYMNFDSLDELAIKYVGDSQLSLSAHNPYNHSTTVWWDNDDNKKYVELYGFRNNFESDYVTIHNDGCTYYWPQDVRNDQHLTEWDYILVKHVDSSGNITLRYTQLEVEMPDLDSIEGDITNIYGEINNFYEEIQYLSACIDDLSGHLSGDYWESGGDSGTCYGSNIADSNQIIVIDLDNHALEGNWNCTNGTFYSGYFDVGCSISLGNTTIGHNNIHLDGQLDFVGGCTYFSDGHLYINGTINADGSITAGCGFYTGCAYLDPNTVKVGCGIIIGCTSLSESQLSSLLALL